MKKQIIAVVFILCLVLSVGCISVYAEENASDDTVTFYLDCPEGFSNGEPIILDTGIDEDRIEGEYIGDNLYKFVVEDISNIYALRIICDNDSDKKDDNYNDVSFGIMNGMVGKDMFSDTLVYIDGMILSNLIYYEADTFDYHNWHYGYGQWMTPEEWQQHEAFLEYINNGKTIAPVREYEPDEEDLWYRYKELYRCVKLNTDEGYSYYCLGFGSLPERADKAIYGVYGDYLLRGENQYSPEAFGYNIYISSENKCMSLREAVNRNIDGINLVFTDYGLGELIGDVNSDGKLNIRDATFIQKCLANIEEFATDDEVVGECENGSEMLKYVSDYNRDGERNIKDVTAIQKHLAKII
ncbi:MAG: dockerin type I repeat-containing protein [Ruminococcus sp.]|nr:dockerin type I repeat-containing protein [Ruminococcus sp.]